MENLARMSSVTSGSGYESTTNGIDAVADRAVPLACSLSAEEAHDRVGRWNRLILEAKLSARAREGLVQAEFRNDAAVRKELEILVAAERECCPFLQFDLRECETELIVTVTALNADAAEDLPMLAAALGIT